jgi:hypothetical protein
MEKYKVVMNGCTRCKDGGYRIMALYGTYSFCVQHFTQRGAQTVVRNLKKEFPDRTIEIKEVKG